SPELPRPSWTGMAFGTPLSAGNELTKFFLQSRQPGTEDTISNRIYSLGRFTFRDLELCRPDNKTRLVFSHRQDFDAGPVATDRHRRFQNDVIHAPAWIGQPGQLLTDMSAIGEME